MPFIRDPAGRRADLAVALRWAGRLLLVALTWGYVLPRMVSSERGWLVLSGMLLGLTDLLWMGIQAIHLYRALRIRRGCDDYPKLSNRRW